MNGIFTDFFKDIKTIKLDNLVARSILIGSWDTSLSRGRSLFNNLVFDGGFYIFPLTAVGLGVDVVMMSFLGGATTFFACLVGC